MVLTHRYLDSSGLLFDQKEYYIGRLRVQNFRVSLLSVAQRRESQGMAFVSLRQSDRVLQVSQRQDWQHSALWLLDSRFRGGGDDDDANLRLAILSIPVGAGLQAQLRELVFRLLRLPARLLLVLWELTRQESPALSRAAAPVHGDVCHHE